MPTRPALLPPLPDRFHEVLGEGLTALAVDLSADQRDSLDAYVRLLLAWTAAINLTAIREPELVARDHLLDSLSALTLPQIPRTGRLLDLGSGGGLPGIPLAIALPRAHVLLVESIGKKALFLRTAAEALGLEGRVGVAAARAEVLATVGRGRAAFDVVTVRAVAALPELIELGLPLLRIGGCLVAWKRTLQDGEIGAGRDAARAIGGEINVVPVRAAGLEGRCLVVVTKVRSTHPRFPRSPTERRSQPV